MLLDGDKHRGKAIRPQRPSLRSDWTCAEPGGGRTGRRSVSPTPVREAELMTSKRRMHSPPPYGVGGCGPANRTTGKRLTANSDFNKTPLKLTDEPLGSFERQSRSPGMLTGLRQIVPRDCMKHLSEPPEDFKTKVQCRSRSCPPPPSGEIVHKQKNVSPNKMVSNINVTGGVLAGDVPVKRSCKGGVQMGMNNQNFVVTRQQHAPTASRTAVRSASYSPQRNDGDLPMYVAKKRFGGGGVFSGHGTAAAMCWNKPAEYTFARKRLQHQQSDNVNLALTGRSIPEAPRGKRGVTGQSLTFCSHAVTNAEFLPDTRHSAARAQRPNSTYAHTRLW
eukprot:TRINITY_DN6778_c0_g1_i4.p2 TRINITY_DN6778_c0_g1~~TRINITY_DN6778_c0_g1_i4.p2  ORF type:complete len:343 (+),score=82.15 TRINITY_DN6778_c0_g1_i4:29-1030(+)